MNSLYPLTPDDPRPAVKMPPEPFYDPSTIYHESDGEWQPVPDWIAYTAFGVGIAFFSVVCWACWLIAHGGR